MWRRWGSEEVGEVRSGQCGGGEDEECGCIGWEEEEWECICTTASLGSNVT